MFDAEPDIIINGEKLSVGEAMTVRVALTCFQWDLQDKLKEEPPGTGHKISKSYLNNLGYIFAKILKDK